MSTINKKYLNHKELNELTNKLLSCRHNVYTSETETETKTNLITSVDVPDTQDFIKITFCDGTIQTIWLYQYQLPKFDHKTDVTPNLSVLSLSRFLERVMNTITQAFY